MGMTRLGPGGMLRLGTVLWGGLALVVSCAMPSRPSGGPRAWIPPMVVSTWPDTFEVIEPTRKPVVIRYSTRLSERPTEGTLDNAVLVSPATSGHRVKLTRNGLEISVTGGFRPDLVYRVRVLPTIKDLFGNAMEGPFELVFSTGGEFEPNVIAGLATDRISGDPCPTCGWRPGTPKSTRTGPRTWPSPTRRGSTCFATSPPGPTVSPCSRTSTATPDRTSGSFRPKRKRRWAWNRPGPTPSSRR
jgi:hypothetical protein